MQTMLRFSWLLMLVIVFLPTGTVIADTTTDSLPIHLTDEELLRLHEIGKFHQRTAPPSGIIRNPGEWEPSEGVIIRWPLGIPVALVAEMSEDLRVTTIVGSITQQNSAIATYQANGVTMSNTDFIIAATDSMWTRDYGPWFIFRDETLAIVDHIYNRPRPNDDVIPQVIGTNWGMEVYGMDLIHTGGNHMSDGLGMSMSTRLVYDENSSKPISTIHELMQSYLGNAYTVLDYIENGGIHHIDCWAKFVNPGTVLVKDVAPSHASYTRLNERAAFLAQQTSAWGRPYNVYRIYCPSGTAYTNSIILNNKVFVPLFGNSSDEAALQVYRDVMPGYEVLGFTGSWLEDDAIHCRTMGVPDRGMLSIDHIPIASVNLSDPGYLVQATITACSGQMLLPNSLLVTYRVNQGNWTSISLTAAGGTGNYQAMIPSQPHGSTISYYLAACDASGRCEYHPYVGELGPHTFNVPQTVPDTTQWAAILLIMLLSAILTIRKRSVPVRH